MVAALVLFGPVGNGLAQTTAPAITPDQRAGLERLALGKARTQLFDRLRETPIAEGVTIGAWMAPRLELERALRLWVRTLPRNGPARHYSDGLCEVDIRLQPGALRDELLALRAKFSNDNPAAGATPAGDTVSETRIKSAALDWPTIWITASADIAELPASGKPLGWEDVRPEGMEMAKRAASADGLYALFATAGHLKVNNARRLDEFLASSPAVEKAVQSGLAKGAKVTVELAADQLAVATATISMTDLLRLLTEVQQRDYTGDTFGPGDLREMALQARVQELSALGLATPPSTMRIRSEYAEIELDAPAWAKTTLRATASLPPTAGDAVDPATRAEQARLQGLLKLRDQVVKLPLKGDVTVEAWLAYYVDLKDDVVVFLSGARPIGPIRTAKDGTTEIDVELPLRRLWEIMRRKMERVEVEPEPIAASQPATSSAPAAVGAGQ